MRYKIGAAVRLAHRYDTHLGRLSADTPGVILEIRHDRAKIRVEAGEIWIDVNRLLPAQRALEETNEL